MSRQESLLPSQRQTTVVEAQIRTAARRAGLVTSRNARTFFEHGHWWIENSDTGAQWDAVDTNNGFDFEQVTRGTE